MEWVEKRGGEELEELHVEQHPRAGFTSSYARKAQNSKPCERQAHPQRFPFWPYLEVFFNMWIIHILHVKGKIQYDKFFKKINNVMQKFDCGRGKRQREREVGKEMKRR